MNRHVKWKWNWLARPGFGHGIAPPIAGPRPIDADLAPNTWTTIDGRISFFRRILFDGTSFSVCALPQADKTILDAAVDHLDQMILELALCPRTVH